MAAGADTMKQFDDTMLGLARIGKISRERLPGTGCQVLGSSDIRPPRLEAAQKRWMTTLDAASQSPEPQRTAPASRLQVRGGVDRGFFSNRSRDDVHERREARAAQHARDVRRN